MKTLISTLCIAALLWLGTCLKTKEQTPVQATKNWNPNAGLVAALTQNAVVSVSSGNNAGAITDANTHTFWQSDAPFPFGFINKPHLNCLLHIANKQNSTATGTDVATAATDGNLSTSVKIAPTLPTQTALWQLKLPEPQILYSISVKAGFTAALTLFVHLTNGQTIKAYTFQQKDNYRLIRFKPDVDAAIQSISLQSTQEFTLFEIAALNAPPSEYATVDMGEQKTVGLLETRQWSTTPGAIVNTQLLLSTDSVQWVQVAQLQASAQGKVTTIVQPPVKARYIRLQHTLSDNDWQKAEIWEITAYNPDGPYGAMPPAKPQPKTMRQLLGINGIWGWGYNKCSSELPNNKGAGQYKQVASFARNYHNLDWDVNNPNHTPNFELMAMGKGTEAQPWLNWDKEYSTWKAAGLQVQVSLQFTNASHPANIWQNPYTAAYNYGYAFARHFGPTQGNGLVNTLEIGNEPWDYPPDFYRQILHGMAQGISDADAKMQILPCAMQAAVPDVPDADTHNYIGSMLSPKEAGLIHALNVHAYSYATNEQGNRIAVQPEHICSDMRSVLNMLRFRDANLPDMPVQLTEWGWDSSGANEDCLHSECVSEEQQANYAIRAALIAARWGLDRICWFFYANGSGGSSVFNRSGLSGSVNTGFAPKKSFVALQSMLQYLGNTHFLKLIQEDNSAWVYAFGNTNGEITHLVAWQPVAGNDADHIMANIQIPYPKKPAKAWILDGENISGTQPTTMPHWENGIIKAQISATPLVIELQ